jgi:hypothetical protein
VAVVVTFPGAPEKGTGRGERSDAAGRPQGRLLDGRWLLPCLDTSLCRACRAVKATHAARRSSVRRRPCRASGQGVRCRPDKRRCGSWGDFMSGVGEPALQEAKKPGVRPFRSRSDPNSVDARRRVSFPELVQAHFIRKNACGRAPFFSAPTHRLREDATRQGNPASGHALEGTPTAERRQ